MPRRGYARTLVSGVILPSLIVLVSSLACNATFGVPAASTNGAPAGTILFIAPENNSVIAEGATISFAASAANNAGILKVEFFVDDTSIGVQTPPTTGQSNFTAMQSWTSAGKQGHLIQAVASGVDGKPFGSAKLTLTVIAAPNVVAGVASAAAIIVATASDGASSNGSSSAVSGGGTVAPAITSIATPLPPLPSPVPVTPSSVPAVAQAVQPTAAPPTITIVALYGANVHSGDGTAFPTIGLLNKGDTGVIVGRNANSTWWAIQAGQMTGWIFNSATVLTVTGDTANVPLVKSPPRPAQTSVPTQPQAQAPTSTAGAYADLVIDSVTLNPPTPTANQTFNVTVVIRNQGQLDAGGSLLSGIFQPGSQKSEVPVPTIKAGQSVTVSLPVTLASNGANQTGVITADKNNDINEGPNGKANNSRTITYNVN